MDELKTYEEENIHDHRECSEHPALAALLIELRIDSKHTKEITEEIKLNQKELNDKMDVLISRRLDDSRLCEKHRDNLSTELDGKIAIPAEAIKKNTEFRENVKYYLIAVATLAAYLKFFI